jgi:spore maturation protein CgeE
MTLNKKDNHLNQIIAMEHAYMMMFSNYKAVGQKDVYCDPAIKDMYTHNFTLYKDCELLLEDIPKELKNTHRDFFRVETYHDLSGFDFTTLSPAPEKTIYELYHSDASSYHMLSEVRECRVEKATTAIHFADGEAVDIAANTPSMGADFTKRRIKRKCDVYKQPQHAIDFYVCYYKDIPVGNIEYAYNTTIVKLEDFDILPEYQRKGLGHTVLRHLLKRAYDSNINDVYLLTDKEDTARYMYKKCGFKKVGEKTELFFQLKNNT